MADFTKYLDRNFREIRSGLVSLKDFQEYLQGLGIPVEVREQCKRDLQMFDHDGHGEINFEDFQGWFSKLPDGYLSKLLRRMAEEEAIQIKRESVARDDADPNAGARPLVRAMFRILDRNNDGSVTTSELVELMHNFGFASLSDGDEDWIELENDEGVSFDEFYEWWSIEGTFKYSGGGIYQTVADAYNHFGARKDGRVKKSEVKAYFQMIGCKDQQLSSVMSMFDKADKFGGSPSGSITFEAFAALLQDQPEAIHTLLRKHAKRQSQKQYRKAELITARAMFAKYDPKNTGTVPLSVVDSLLTDFGIGKVDMSDEDINEQHLQFPGIFAWWSQEGRLKPEEPTKGVVGVRGLLYAHKHFVEPTQKKGDSSDTVNLESFYSYLLHNNICEWHLQLAIGCLELGSEKDTRASVPVSYREFVARIGAAPKPVIDLLQKSARETLPVATSADLAEDEGVNDAGETYDVPTETSSTTEGKSKDKKDKKKKRKDSITVREDDGALHEPVRSGWKYTDRGVTYYCNNTVGNWGWILLALFTHWSVIALFMMGVIAASTQWGVELLYIYFIGFCIFIVVLVSVVVVGTVEQSKKPKEVLIEDKPIHQQDRRSMIRSKASTA